MTIINRYFSISNCKINILSFIYLQEFPLDELSTHVVPLEDISKGFEILKDPNCVKVVIKISH